MKSIKEIAAELETTPQNIYLRLKQNNIPLKDLKGKKQGRTTLYDEEAEQTIKGIFQTTSKEPDNETIETIEIIEKLKKELEEEKKAAITAREELAAAQEEITRLRDVERQLIKQVSDMIETEKEKKSGTISTLPQAEAQRPKRPIALTKFLPNIIQEICI